MNSRGVVAGREDRWVSTTTRSGLRAFVTELPPEGRWLLSTVVVQFVGRGLTLPFTIIYLHEVRGFDLGLSGVLIGLIAVVAVVVTVPGGSLIDRYGARPVVLAGLLAAVAGNVTLAFASTPPVAATGLVLIGVFYGVSWPGVNALVATVVSGDARQRYYGVNFALLNLGVGVGGVVGGLVVDVQHPLTFTAAFLATGAGQVAPLLVLLGPLRHVSGRPQQPAPAAGPEGVVAVPSSYVAILRQPAVMWFVVVTFLCTFVGYGQMESGFPAYARQVSEVSTRIVGFAFVINTVAIVGLQFVVMDRIAGRRRSRVLVLLAGVWAAAWLLLGATGLAAGSAAAAVGVLAFHAVFGFGETMMQTVIPALTNDLAPDHLRGRYNAINSAAFQGGTIAGPVLAGLLLGHGLSAGFIVAMVVGCAAIGLGALALERRVTATVNGVRGKVLETARP